MAIYNRGQVIRAWLALACLFCGSWLRAETGAMVAAPSYSAESIVNAASYAPGPLAPNSLGTIFGVDLSFEKASATVLNNRLTTELAGVRVYVMDMPAPLFYVSAEQINFLVPGNLIAGNVKVRVIRQGVTGPDVIVRLVDAAPGLFLWPDRKDPIVVHGDNTTYVTSGAPARPGETVVIYAAGLGRTAPDPGAGEILMVQMPLKQPDSLKVYLGGAALEPWRIKYAGLTPGSPGLYQVNLELPEGAANDPEIRFLVGEQASAPGLKLPLRPLEPQLSVAGTR